MIRFGSAGNTLMLILQGDFEPGVEWERPVLTAETGLWWTTLGSLTRERISGLTVIS